MNTLPSRIRASTDVLLFRSERGQWVNFIRDDARECEAQLLQNETGYLLLCLQDGQVIYQCNASATMTIQRMDADFLQVASRSGVDGIALGMKFRNQLDAGNFMALLEQSTSSGYTSVPNTTPHHGYQQPEFATVPGGSNYRGAPNMRGEGGYYLREQFERGQGHYPEQRQYQPSHNAMQHQQPVEGRAHMPTQSTNQGGVQDVQSSHTPVQQSKPVIKSKQELERYTELLAVALTEDDTDFAKSVVKLLVEAKGNQTNFGVKFLPDGAKTYFKLCVKIEREMFLGNYPVTYYLLVNEDYTIKHLQEMIELKFSIKSDQQHWIIGKVFASDKEATLRSFGIKSKGAEVHLFISKGDAVAATDDMTKDNQQHGHQYQDQQYSQSYQDRQYSQSYQDQQNYQSYSDQQYHQQQQGQCNSPTNQSYSYQQQQQFSPQSNNYQAQNSYSSSSLPPPDPSTHQQYSRGQATQTSQKLSQPVVPSNQSVAVARQAVAKQPEAAMMKQPRMKQPEVIKKEPEKPVRPPTPPKIGWTCPVCTVINDPFRPGCEVCGADRPEDYKPPADYKPSKDEERFLQEDRGLEEYQREQKELQEKQARENYQMMLDMANRELIPNDVEFDCPICMGPIAVGEGVKLRECLHHCCKDCLRDHILTFRDADVLCPCNEEFDCKGSVTQLEMKALLSEEELEKVHNRGLALAEGQSRSFHCKTPDCKGWCVYEDEVNEFDCPVCTKRNCLLCKAIHYPEMNCKEYQEDLRIKAANDEAAQATQKMLEDMVKNGDAMYCPNENCGLILQKKDGCDWVQCSCRTEICWVTKKPRRGPNGCGCNYWGKRCHENCKNCH